MRAQDRKVVFDGNHVEPCPSCGSKKKVRWYYRDIVLAALHWPARGGCAGCCWSYQDTHILYAPGQRGLYRQRLSWAVMTGGALT